MSIRKLLQEGLLTPLWRLVSIHPGAVIAVGLIFAIISAAAAFLFLGLNSDQDRLVSSEVPFHKRYLAHIKNFGDQEYLYVVIKTGATEEGKKRAIEFAENLNGRLRQHQKLIQAV
ncbi:MAG: RND transporter, partial [Desulfobacteraceae bacterium]|nr:RND transporter [Desulfobacteraceae bacterium]